MGTVVCALCGNPINVNDRVTHIEFIRVKKFDDDGAYDYDTYEDVQLHTRCFGGTQISPLLLIKARNWEV